MNTKTQLSNKESEEKVITVTNINQLGIGQKRIIGISIGEFLASIVLERTRNTAQFDNEVVKSYLKLNK